METRITEQSSHYDHLEQMTVEQITEGINNESMSVAVAVGKALPRLNSLISAIEERGSRGWQTLLCGLRHGRTFGYARHH